MPLDGSSAQPSEDQDLYNRLDPVLMLFAVMLSGAAFWVGIFWLLKEAFSP